MSEIINPDRQHKKDIMRVTGCTGKRYRKAVKRMRRMKKQNA
jgi:hypothetical protein